VAAGWERVNLLEVENSAERFGLAPALEARFARRPLGADRSGVSYQKLAPGFRIPFGHDHEDQEEHYLVLSGSGRLALDDEVIEVNQWDLVRIAPSTMRCAEAGEDGLELLLFGAGRAGDTEPTPGWWGG
jgi:mannose-6-phosphate isomerase-like protein (cupin superfamily)